MIRVTQLKVQVSAHFSVELGQLEVKSGEIACFLGKSGSGKTTLLNALAGFFPLASGEIEINGRRVEALPTELRRIAMVFQEIALFPHLKVIENVAFGLKVQGFSKKDRMDRARYWLNKVELQDFSERFPHQLSGGQAQRVAFARAFAVGFEVVALDEPFASLDVGLKKELRQVVRGLAQSSGTTVLLVSHDPDDVSALADQVVWLEAGRVRSQGSVAQILPLYRIS